MIMRIGFLYSTIWCPTAELCYLMYCFHYCPNFNLITEHRHVGSTNFNLLSSRSHTIFSLVSLQGLKGTVIFFLYILLLCPNYIDVYTKFCLCSHLDTYLCAVICDKHVAHPNYIDVYIICLEGFVFCAKSNLFMM